MQRQGRGRSLKDSLSGGELGRLRANDFASTISGSEKLQTVQLLLFRNTLRDRRSASALEAWAGERALSIRAPNPISSLGGKATGTKLHLHHKCPLVAFASARDAGPAVTEAIFFTTPLATWMRSCGGGRIYRQKRV